MLRSMISSKRITARFPSSPAGISTTLARTLGTWTVANSSSFFSPFLERREPMFKDLLRIRGKGREESTAMGVSTGYTFSSK